ncbi:MAG TPA: hypothetical protein VFB63_30380 [Bryobacteraceae bacterium]|nr:hypothetical protein [Bryobacteraceae bacterium]
MSLPHQPRWDRQTSDHDDRDRHLDRIATSLERLVKLFDEFAGALLNARFTGKGSDRWARR